MSPHLALPVVSFFMADVGGGIGPYLSVWLQDRAGFGPEQVGTVLTVGSVVGAVAATPAGHLVDRLGHPRLLLAIACALIVAGTLALIPLRALWAVAIAQSLVSAGGALGGPSITGLSLAIVGKKLFPRQQGTNDAANHAGNVVSNLVIAGLSSLVGIAAAFGVLAAMASATCVALLLIPAGAVDETRMHGRAPHPPARRDGATRELLRNRRLLLLLGAIALFNLGNVAMLPMLVLRIKAMGGEDPTRWVSIAVIVLYVTMIPVALLGARAAERFGRRPVLMTAFVVLPVRALAAVFARDVAWLVPIEMLDAVGAGIISVAGPPAVTDCTYGGGRTQTAIGAMQSASAAAGALSTLLAGVIAAHLGWPATFSALAAFPVLGFMVLRRVDLPRNEDHPHVPAAATRVAV